MNVVSVVPLYDNTTRELSVGDLTHTTQELLIVCQHLLVVPSQGSTLLHDELAQMAVMVMVAIISFFIVSVF